MFYILTTFINLLKTSRFNFVKMFAFCESDYITKSVMFMRSQLCLLIYKVVNVTIDMLFYIVALQNSCKIVVQ